MALRGALIHRARLVDRKAWSRNEQGEKQLSENAGPWFKARLMERVGAAGKSRRRDNGTDARAPVGYELLADFIDENGDAVVLTASSLVQTDCALLGSPIVTMEGKPELLNNGRRKIGWDAMCVKAGDAS